MELEHDGMRPAAALRAARNASITDLGAWLPPEVREIRYHTRQALGRDIFCPDLQPNDLANSE
jgi:hypothetical protein